MLVQRRLLLSPDRSSMLPKEVPGTTLLDKRATRVCEEAGYTPASQRVPYSSFVFLDLGSHFVGTILGTSNGCPHRDFPSEPRVLHFR